MGTFAQKLRGQVAVITGASSGIGRSAAQELARAGCRVVCAARRATELEETVSKCTSAGGEAFAFVTDVTREEDVERLAQAALARWGRIDVWVNNAGVALFSPLEKSPFSAHQRVIETNVFGAMHGARAVLPIFRRQGHGVLINVGSVLSRVGHPFVPSYVISKFAIRGLTEALRVELADEPDIHVCLLMPYAVDTPHFEAGANIMGHHPRAMPPVLAPERVARAIRRLAARPRREMLVPRIVRLGLGMRWAFPRTSEQLLLHALERWHFDSAEESPTPGNLFRPRRSQRGHVHGTRPPQLSAPRLVGWLLSDLVRIQQARLTRGVRGLTRSRAAQPQSAVRPAGANGGGSRWPAPSRNTTQ